MFEKCGLKDIFYRLFKMKWIFIAMVVVITLVGIGGYSIYLNRQAQNQDNSNNYASQLCYYVHSTLGADSKSNFDPAQADVSQRNNFALTIETMMKSKTVGRDIFDKLLETFSEDEIASKIGQKGLNWQEYNESLYKLTPENSSTIIIDVSGVSEDAIYVLTEAINSEVMKLSDSIGSGYLENYDTLFIIPSSTNDVASGISTSKAATIFIIAIVISLIIILAIAIFNPTINFAEDFSMYNVTYLSSAKKKMIPIAARAIIKKMEAVGAEKIAIATSLCKSKKAKETFDAINEEISKISDGKYEVTFAPNPNLVGESSDVCQSAKNVVLLEEAGRTTHKRFGFELNYLENMEVKVLGSILL